MASHVLVCSSRSTFSALSEMPPLAEVATVGAERAAQLGAVAVLLRAQRPVAVDAVVQVGTEAQVVQQV